MARLGPTGRSDSTPSQSSGRFALFSFGRPLIAGLPGCLSNTYPFENLDHNPYTILRRKATIFRVYFLGSLLLCLVLSLTIVFRW